MMDVSFILSTVDSTSYTVFDNYQLAIKNNENDILHLLNILIPIDL